MTITKPKRTAFAILYMLRILLLWTTIWKKEKNIRFLFGIVDVCCCFVCASNWCMRASYLNGLLCFVRSVAILSVDFVFQKPNFVYYSVCYCACVWLYVRIQTEQTSICVISLLHTWTLFCFRAGSFIFFTFYIKKKRICFLFSSCTVRVACKENVWCFVSCLFVVKIHGNKN